MDHPDSIPRDRKNNAHYIGLQFHVHELKITGYVKLV